MREQKQKQNLVIHSKKLPKSVENDRKNFESSTEGKAMRGEASAFQKRWQGSVDEAMMHQKRETGSTGMSNEKMNDLLDETYDRNMHRTVFGQGGKRKPAMTKTFVQRRVLVNGEWQNMMVQTAGPRD